jgi:zinc finger protein 830
MSASFKLAKKKVSQQDLRKLMQEQKSLRLNEEVNKKIDSPFAKYEDGKLSCILCKKSIKEAVWKVHINSSQHKDNLSKAKQLKEKLVARNESLRGIGSIQERVAALKKDNKLKGILKNSFQATTTDNIQTSEQEKLKDMKPGSESVLPDDFFDSMNKNVPKKEASRDTLEKMQVDEVPLPEGFFDDPVKDAKARNLEYQNPVEAEWEQFKKEIKEVTEQSLSIINDEHIDSTVERQIDEIEKSISSWSR